ncbi:MAG: mechanosensitive ion channel [Deltaproteobacteria bacterium]|nr:mechanosensitive ion channel [Deltaproteobacteria bacterium]
MKRFTPVVLAVLMAHCLIGLVGGSADAEVAPTAQEIDGAEAVVPALVAAGDALVEENTALRTRLVNLQERIKGAVGEDLVVLEHQLVEVKLEYLELLAEMVDNLITQEEKGHDASALRSLIESALNELGPSITRHIDVSNQLLTDLRTQRSDVEPGRLLSHEQKISREITWLQSLYRAYLNLTIDLAKVGLESDVLRENLAERLAERGDLLAGRIKITMDLFEPLNARRESAPDDLALQTQLRALQQRDVALAGALAEVAEMMDQVGLDSSEHRQFLVRSTGNLGTNLFRGRVMLGLMEEWLTGLRDWLAANGPRVIMNALGFVMILVLFSLIARLVERLLRRGMVGSQTKPSQLLQNMVNGLTGRGIMLLGLLVALSQLGIELGPILAGLGIAGFIVGFALQDSLSNFAAGIMILAYRPYDVDDLIEAGGVFGVVNDMNLVSTTVLTLDNQTLIVPNAKIWGDVIKNITNQKLRRVDMKFRVSYAQNIEEIEHIFAEILANNDLVVADPEPMIKLHTLEESWMEFVVRPWVETADYWDVYWAVTRAVKVAFDEKGIEIPLPQREVSVRQIAPPASPE